ncbi:MAG: hypothetical protein Q8K75_01300 [Chlamydiales bacterium]|nr:hypothetical protein [Chlamydiales bacterium]
MNTDFRSVPPLRTALPTEAQQKIEAKKESPSTSKTREVFNFAKDVTVIVGATFGTLLLINYVGESVRGYGDSLMSWAQNVVNETDITNKHCFNFANYSKCVEEKNMAPRVYEMGVLISRIGSGLESGSAAYLNAFSAPFYSAYHASSSVYNQISSFVTANLCELVCDKHRPTVEMPVPLVATLRSYIPSYESTIDSMTKVFENGKEELSKLSRFIPSYHFSSSTSYSKWI